MSDDGKQFLDNHIERISVLGFWTEQSKSIIIKNMELNFKTEVIKYWYIEDFTINGDKVLIKWQKRFEPLTDEELLEDYGRKVKK